VQGPLGGELALSPSHHICHRSTPMTLFDVNKTELIDIVA